MTSADRPRRSCLTVPGSSERFLAKARTLAPDELILDLEDAVAPAAKDTARTLVIEALAAEWEGTGFVLENLEKLRRIVLHYRAHLERAETLRRENVLAVQQRLRFRAIPETADAACRCRLGRQWWAMGP